MKKNIGMVKELMNLLHDAYIALLSGLTYKTGNEIHWHDGWNRPLTIEITNVKNNEYIVRYYHTNGTIAAECGYKNGKPHGKSISWHLNGNKWHEIEYRDGILHGNRIEWYENGNKFSQMKYKNNKAYGKFVLWSKNGQKYHEENIRDGMKVK